LLQRLNLRTWGKSGIGAPVFRRNDQFVQAQYNAGESYGITGKITNTGHDHVFLLLLFGAPSAVDDAWGAVRRDASCKRLGLLSGAKR
jgi:hypothetical protein